jgi:Uma2 family endonuclease
MDTVAKRSEYARARILQYWTVGQDPAQTVTMYRLDRDHYETRATMPLAWVLNTTPAEHDLG